MPHLSRRQLIQTLGVTPFATWSTASSAAPLATVDVVVIGSGAAGMTAALSARQQGLSVLILEKAATFGGSTARSGAGIWVRNNEVLQAAGVVDTPAQAATYLDAVVGDEVSAERKAAYLAQGPAMISFILKHTPLKFRFMAGYSDYFPELPGGLAGGASIEPELFNGRLLGSELARLTAPYLAVPPGVAIFGGEYRWLNLAAVNAKGVSVAAGAVARYSGARLRGEVPLTMGQALAGGLRAGLLGAQVPVWHDTPLLDLQRDSRGRVTGVWALREGQRQFIAARRGVVIASGGFEHNLAMRLRHQQQPITTDWTVGAASNTGDGIQAGQRIGAALGLMDDAWWGPVIPLPEGPYFVLSERSLPGSIMVDDQGQRFVNEAAPYTEFVHTLYRRVAQGHSVNNWMVIDQRNRNRYLFKTSLPGLGLPKAWFEAGVAHKAATLEELARKMGVNPATLRQTVTRFNAQAAAGRDLDFQRGDSAYDRYYADPAVRPNPSLAALQQAPFYAFQIRPGDLGTKGGLLTDARARVLHEDGQPIDGLYAAGNASAAVMGRSYAGAGSTLGPAMTFGFVAGQDLARQATA
jgi:3-oxosteroid 1-dehydrogenase